MTSPFSVLHVCTGNICRSPMSERILDGLTGDDVFNHGAGTGSWHVGDDMQAGSRHELDTRGFVSAGHRARHLERAHVEASDLILVATEDHVDYITERFPEVLGRTFLVRQFGFIVADLIEEGFAAPAGGDAAVRGKALVNAAAERTVDYPLVGLSDPWGMDQATYARIADQLEEALKPVALALESRL
ncbi:arsenate reductase/protein-tyrosine-phosphatase family protein [Glycomyces rhizosphaerae]|uniref:protein-tyrosine-phosphatase n=1 Tax=Glycomyces rhizosphaerae TaxID=2054422 RepID=A0ABV7PUU9_9ACTN